MFPPLQNLFLQHESLQHLLLGRELGVILPEAAVDEPIGLAPLLVLPQQSLLSLQSQFLNIFTSEEKEYYFLDGLEARDSRKPALRCILLPQDFVFLLIDAHLEGVRNSHAASLQPLPRRNGVGLLRLSHRLDV